ncbi:MAG: DUF4013 domain-containing protein [Halobacteriota archaeon]
MKDIGEAIAYPMENDEWITTVGIGGILALLGVFLIPLFLVYGYVVRVIRASTAGEPEPPTFGDWGALLVEGLQAWVIGLVYMLIPVVVGAVTVGSSIAALATGSEAGAAAGFGGMFVGLTVTFLLTIVFGYVAVAAVVNFAREERFGAGFDVGVIQQVAFDREYAIAWLVSAVGFFAVSLVGGIPFIGWIVAPFVGFYVAIVAADLWADGFASAIDTV